MKKTTLIGLMFCMLVLSMLSACGGGSSNSSPHQPTSATLTLSTTLTGTFPTPTTTINGYEVTITLPTGVTVKTMSTATTAQTGTGVVVTSGKASNAIAYGMYTAASGTAPGMIKVYLADTMGFDAGEFCIVKGDIASGYYPTASSFIMPNLDVATGCDDAICTNSLDLKKELSLSAAITIQ